MGEDYSHLTDEQIRAEKHYATIIISLSLSVTIIIYPNL